MLNTTRSLGAYAMYHITNTETHSNLLLKEVIMEKTQNSEQIPFHL